VYGTDLSEVALEKARAGFYRGRSLANVTPELLARYFEPRGEGHLVSGALRESVRFEQLNLLDPFPELLRGCDAIFCQNVTIYFQAETRRDLIARFYASLPPEGLLFLGFSETLWNVFDGFRSREVSGAYVYYKGEPEPPPAQRRAWSLPRRTQDETPQRLRPARAGHAAHQPAMGAQTRPAPAAQPAPRADDAATLAQSRALLDAGQVGQAIELLRHISPESALATQALTLVARAHADRGDLELAVAEIRRALEINTLNEEAYLLLGVIYARQGEWKTAVAELERARYLSPASPLVSFHLADAYRHAGRADQAAREYRSALRKLEPHAADTLLDGVAVGWLRATCERRLEGIAGGLGRR
jgi:chemotaxis protein methyltransferase CheR